MPTIALLLTLAAFLGCVDQQAFSSTSDSSRTTEVDSALFSTIVRAIDTTGFKSISVDPRPLNADPLTTDWAAEDLAHVSAQTIADRTNVLENLGISETNLTVSERRCARTLVLAAAPPETRAEWSIGCPESGRLKEVIIGLPRAGGPFGPGSVIDERLSGERLGHWSVRVIEIIYGPNGSVGEVSDYVVRRTPDGSGWQLVKKHLFYYDE